MEIGQNVYSAIAINPDRWWEAAYGMVWYDMVQYGMVWYDVVWYVMIWYDCLFPALPTSPVGAPLPRPGRGWAILQG